MKSSKTNLAPAGPYATKEDRAAFLQVIAKGNIVTFGITPQQGKKNIAQARKKAAAMNLQIERVTLKRKPR